MRLLEIGSLILNEKRLCDLFTYFSSLWNLLRFDWFELVRCHLNKKLSLLYTSWMVLYRNIQNNIQKKKRNLRKPELCEWNYLKNQNSKCTNNVAFCVLNFGIITCSFQSLEWAKPNGKWNEHWWALKSLCCPVAYFEADILFCFIICWSRTSKFLVELLLLRQVM